MTPESISPIGLNVARYRKAEGLSAAELADLVGEGMTRSVLANLENGRKDDVTLKQLLSLAVALRVPPAALVVDVLDPWGATPYRHPDSLTVTVTNFEISTAERDKKAMNNHHFFKWFGGQDSKSKKGATGAARIVGDAVSATESYDRAFLAFVQATWTLAPKMVSADGDEREEIESFVRNSAQNLLDWSERLSGMGIETNVEKSVYQQLAKVGVSLGPRAPKSE